jgi:hypothetical protein
MLKVELLDNTSSYPKEFLFDFQVLREQYELMDNSETENEEKTLFWPEEEQRVKQLFHLWNEGAKVLDAFSPEDIIQLSICTGKYLADTLHFMLLDYVLVTFSTNK